MVPKQRRRRRRMNKVMVRRTRMQTWRSIEGWEERKKGKDGKV